MMYIIEQGKLGFGLIDWRRC